MTIVATGASGVQIAIKQEFDLTDEELARATGAGVRTIRRLLSEEELIFLIFPSMFIVLLLPAVFSIQSVFL